MFSLTLLCGGLPVDYHACRHWTEILCWSQINPLFKIVAGKVPGSLFLLGKMFEQWYKFEQHNIKKKKRANKDM